MLRCTLAGLIPLMMSKKYSSFTEKFYQYLKEDFDDIIKNKSYYLIRDLPVEIASQILKPEIPRISTRQKSDGLWHIKNPAKTTYDILSAFKHINVLDDLIAGNKIKNAGEHIKDKYDYDSLLIKSIIYKHTDENDINAIKDLIQEIKSTQNENGSWEDTIIATVFHIEKLINLGVSCNDCSIKNGIDFLFENLNLNWKGLQNSGKAYGLQCNYVFSTRNRDLEFEAAKKYNEEMVPRQICYKHLGMMQNSLCLKLLVQIGLEDDERVESALDSIYSIFKNYKRLCYFKIQKEFMNKNHKSQSV